MNCEAIADKLESRIDQIVEAWCVAVREDPRIESEQTLTTPELIDHVPALLEEISLLIRNGETPGTRNVNEARANVYTRFYQGYKGRDLVRELSLLRISLLDHLVEISLAEPSGFNLKEWRKAATILNLYLDEEMRYAISIFANTPTIPPP
jgi:RsbT co-antagonist protein rsbRD N-terminal domain